MHKVRLGNGPCESLPALCKHAIRNIPFVVIGEVILVEEACTQ